MGCGNLGMMYLLVDITPTLQMNQLITTHNTTSVELSFGLDLRAASPRFGNSFREVTDSSCVVVVEEDIAPSGFGRGGGTMGRRPGCYAEGKSSCRPTNSPGPQASRSTADLSSLRLWPRRTSTLAVVQARGALSALAPAGCRSEGEGGGRQSASPPSAAPPSLAELRVLSRELPACGLGCSAAV
eukprot:scaffold364_cov401-Prasinococcus_capsulatus_cf.AAC.13